MYIKIQDKKLTEKEKQQLELLLRRYAHAQAELVFMKQVHQIDTELFEIATAQFQAADIAPSVYLPKKRAFLEKSFQLLQQQQLVEQLQTEILIAAKFFWAERPLCCQIVFDCQTYHSSVFYQSAGRSVIC